MSKNISFPLHLVLLVALVSCGASAREKTIRVTYDTTNVLREEFVAWDLKHQEAIVAAANTREEAETRIATYRDHREKLEIAFVAVYRALASALLINGEQTMASMMAAAAELKKLYEEIKKQ